jgi:hypothetical protein
MNLLLIRKFFTPKSTIGHLFIDGQYESFTLEDAVHEGPKVPGQTAIPEGTYRVIIDFSLRFNRLMPHILAVPRFDGIRIHPGNTDADTEGCILVGRIKGCDAIYESRNAFNMLFAKIQTALKADLPVTIEIKHEENKELS